MTAAEIAEAVRSKQRSAAEVLDEHLARVREREADIHAFNLVMEDQARADASAVDQRVAAGEDPGPLAGVPVALKDNFTTRGRRPRRSTNGSPPVTTPVRSRACPSR